MADIPATIQKLKAHKRRIPLIVGAVIIEFIMDNFDKQGFQGASFKKWKVRADESDPGRSVLVGKQSGRGRRSIRIGARTEREITVLAEDYMVLHNKGGKIKVPVTARSRKFFWAMWYNTEDDFWKNMALTKKKVLIITIPPRPFIKKSPVLDRMVKQALEADLQKVFD